MPFLCIVVNFLKCSHAFQYKWYYFHNTNMGTVFSIIVSNIWIIAGLIKPTRVRFTRVSVMAFDFIKECTIESTESTKTNKYTQYTHKTQVDLVKKHLNCSCCRLRYSMKVYEILDKKSFERINKQPHSHQIQ